MNTLSAYFALPCDVKFLPHVLAEASECEGARLGVKGHPSYSIAIECDLRWGNAYSQQCHLVKQRNRGCIALGREGGRGEGGREEREGGRRGREGGEGGREEREEGREGGKVNSDSECCMSLTVPSTLEKSFPLAASYLIRE